MAAKIWLISDTHFGHENMYKFTTFDGTIRVRSRFESAKEGDQYMLDRWNEMVKPEDHIYHLGDVALDRRLQKWIDIIRSLPGHKRLILGNHDKAPIRDYLEAGFEKIMSMRMGDRKRFILSHIPIHPESLGKSLNIHGHIHERDSFGPQWVNVSVERTSYQPVELEEILALTVPSKTC